MRKIILSATAIFGLTVALLIVCEGALRVFLGHRFDLAYQSNKDFLVSLKPNVSKTYTRKKINGGNVIVWKTNKDTFRGKELREKPKFRVLVYGDSNIQARFSELENTFPYKLEQKLKSLTKRDIEVVNAGVVGFGPDQVLLRMKKEADIYHPALVVFHVFADNDFGDIIKNRLLELDDQGNLVRTPFPTTTDQTLVGHNNSYERNPNVPEPLKLLLRFVFSMRTTKVLQELRATMKKAVAKEKPPEALLEELVSFSQKVYAVYKNKKPRVYSHFGDPYDIDIALYPEKESSRIKVALMQAILQEAKKVADSKNIQMLVLIQPSTRDLTTNRKLNFTHFQKYSGYDKRRLTNIVDEICVRANIHRLNLFEIFQKNNPDTLYLKGADDHWNDAGQDLAAQEAAEYIHKNHLL